MSVHRSIALAGTLIIASSIYVAPHGEAQVADRREERVDRAEDRRDRAVDLGPLDRFEDRVDAMENIRDRRTGPYAPAVRWSPAGPRRVVAVPAAPRRMVAVAPRVRVVNGVRVYRPFGPTVFGYGFFYADEDALPWLAFTAISLKLLDNLTEDEVRRQEQAQIEAASAPVGEVIYWESDSAAGSATAIRQGTNASGETCREFHQTVSVEGYAEDAYGVACIGEDGRWRITS